jgi:ABC-2 type transport system permease protein
MRMSNILAIAQKELKAYFASPIAYVLITFFAFFFALFFVPILLFFEEQSRQMSMMGAGQPPFNVNDQLIHPVLSNVSVILLFVLPIVTMRSFAEEKRTGTMELLLTSPLTDVQIVFGKFIGAMGLILAMLAITLPHLGFLFWYGNPEWKPIATAYLGFFLMSGCFLAIGLFISSLTRNQVIAAMATFGVFLMLWVVDWTSRFSRPSIQLVLEYLSITRHFDDFARGVIDTKHLVYYASFIIFGLFLTVRSVETERWRG